MRTLFRFVVVLLAGLALLTVAGHVALNRLNDAWAERDLALRSSLAVAAARESLATSWGLDQQRLSSTLADITRDERIMGASACTLSGILLARTVGFPPSFSCLAVVERLPRERGEVTATWAMSAGLPSGPVHLSATVLEVDHKPLGVILLVHDLSYLGRREATTRNLLLTGFFILSVGASLVTIIAARVAWRGWTGELRRALDGQPTREFEPLVRDVRSLVERLTEERAVEARRGPWTPKRLREVLTQYLQGERVVILANREPYIHERTVGGVEVRHPASGLVTALEPVMRACSGVWVAHGSGSADVETSDGRSRLRVPPGEESYVLRRVWLSEEEENGYYYGFANEGLWPLCHLAHTRPVFREGDFKHYAHVNRRFADAVCEEVDSDDPIVLVQDYHFALAPKMIRERLPRATILTFWHVPWPNAEHVGICPWREEILAGLLGSSIVGFHTQQHCNNFLDSVDAFLERRIDRETNSVVLGPRRTLVRPYPISIEWPVHWLTALPPAADCRASVRREFGLAPDALLGVGIDRLDYTKGIEERLLAVDALLERHPEFRGVFTFAQIAAPSRTKIEKYRELAERVETLAGDINRRWGSGAYRPVILLCAHHEPPAVFRFYRAADLCYVSSLHDGMNLVAKEFVAAREDERGVLVLSQFTGAARDLPEAVVVNPYDVAQSSEALAFALRMPADEQRDRMWSMRRVVSEFNVYRWAGRMLIDAAELRRRERVSGRLSSWSDSSRVAAM